MSKLILYHGSSQIVRKPELKLGKRNNDYGQGFYCTRIIERGKEWACKKELFGFLNVYELDMDGLKVLDLTKAKYNTLTWVTILLKNRTFNKTFDQDLVNKKIIELFDIDISNYDLIIGYRADDSYFSFAQSFISNTLPIQCLSYVLNLGHLGLQYVLVSEKSFKQLKFLSYEQVGEEYHYKFIENDLKIRKEYKDFINKRGLKSDDLFVRDIIKEGFDLNDPRIR